MIRLQKVVVTFAALLLSVTFCTIFVTEAAATTPASTRIAFFIGGISGTNNASSTSTSFSSTSTPSSQAVAFLPKQGRRRQEQQDPPTAAHWFDSRKHYNKGCGGTKSRDTIMWMKRHHSPSAERNREPIWGILEEHVLPQLVVSSSEAPTTPDSDKKLNILEVAAGCGVHTVYFASRLLAYLRNRQPQQQQEPSSSSTLALFHWQSSDPDLSARESQKAYIEEDLAPTEQEPNIYVAAPLDTATSATLKNCVSPTPLSLTLSSNGVEEPETKAMLAPASLDLILNINMIHISPWTATQGLMVLAGETLRPGGILYLYGPYKVQGTPTVPSNLYVLELSVQMCK